MIKCFNTSNISNRLSKIFLAACLVLLVALFHMELTINNNKSSTHINNTKAQETVLLSVIGGKNYTAIFAVRAVAVSQQTFNNTNPFQRNLLTIPITITI